MSVAIRFVTIIFVCFLGNVYGDLGVACPGTPCVPGNHEICDTSVTDVCKCDTGYTAGTSDTTTCFADCSADPGFSHGTLTGDQYFEGTASITCDSGYTAGGGSGSITCQNDGTWDTSAAAACTAVDCPADPGFSHGSLTGDRFYGGTASITCDSGYTAGGGSGSITCQNDGTWDTSGAAACNAVDCGNPSPQAGYSAVAAGGTTYQSTATVSCDTGNGYTGTPPDITCEASGSWSAYSGCSTGGGSVDCGTPSASAGYVPEANPSPTTQGATATVSCAAGYTGTAAQITCEASGSWSAYSGCSSAGTRTKLDFSLITVLAVVMLVLI